jgi:hypothetical protein
MDHSGEHGAYRKTGCFVEGATSLKGLTGKFVEARLSAKSRDLRPKQRSPQHSLENQPQLASDLTEFRGSQSRN